MDIDPIDVVLIILVIVSILVVVGFMTNWFGAKNPSRLFCLLLFKAVNPIPIVGNLLSNLICSPFSSGGVS
jgi:flagellar basal body-associated protein FliL